MRVRFKPGKQRSFLRKVMEKTNCPSLRELSRRIDFNYSTLKNYFTEARFLPEDLFRRLSDLGEIKISVKFLDENWGQRVGGKKSKR